MIAVSINDVMVAYAADAIDLARHGFGTELDFSEASIERVEEMLSGYEASLPRGLVARMFGRQPQQEHLWQLSKIWGAYVGEVIRARWGGEWVSRRGTHRGPDISLVVLGLVLAPPGKVYRRLMLGIEENICHYYEVVKRDLLRAQDTRSRQQ